MIQVHGLLKKYLAKHRHDVQMPVSVHQLPENYILSTVPKWRRMPDLPA